jgi:hypothetical protein
LLRHGEAPAVSVKPNLILKVSKQLALNTRNKTMSEPNRTNPVPDQGEPIQYLRLGDLELWILPDTFFMQEAGLFALEAREHEIAELFRNDLLPANQLRVAACPILLKKDGNLILIDAGIGSQIPGNPGKVCDFGS